MAKFLLHCENGQRGNHYLIMGLHHVCFACMPETISFCNYFHKKEWVPKKCLLGQAKELLLLTAENMILYLYSYMKFTTDKCYKEWILLLSWIFILYFHFYRNKLAGNLDKKWVDELVFCKSQGFYLENSGSKEACSIRLSVLYR